MISDCSSRFSSDWRSERIPMVTLSKSISSAALGAWAGGSLCGRARWACGCVIMWLCVAPGADAVPALPHHECLENKQLARKGTGRLHGCPAAAGDVTFCYETAFGIRSE